MAEIDLTVLSANELSQMTDWPDPVLVEWLNFTRNIAVVNDESGGNQAAIEQNTTDITQNADNLTTHEGETVAHGATGDIVGTGDTAQLALGGVVLLAAAVTDGVDSTVSVDSPDATDLATVITLANENKGDTNQLVADLNLAIAQLNDLLANLRSSGALNT